jgi:hypothetical protein
MAFRLRILTTGLCLHAIRSTGEIAVLMPDARFKGKNTVGTHIDGTPTAPHAGHLLVDLAHLVPGFASRPNDPCARDDNGPLFEVLYRLDCEALRFSLGDPKEVGVRDVDTVRLPNASDFAPPLRLRGDVLDEGAPRPADGMLLFRTWLRGGYAAHCPPDDPAAPREYWSIDGRLKAPGAPPFVDRFAGGIMWTRDVTDEEIEGNDKSLLTLTLDRFDKTRTITVPLRPVDVDGRPTITLKLANLCAENPLEWEELRIRGVLLEDSDFKWMYRLLEPPNGFDKWGDFLQGQVLPAPRMQSQPKTGMEFITNPPGDCSPMLIRVQ